jgi:hypothetical protein
MAIVSRDIHFDRVRNIDRLCLVTKAVEHHSTPKRFAQNNLIRFNASTLQPFNFLTF